MIWLSALSSGLAVLCCGRAVLRRNPFGLTRTQPKKNPKTIECSDVLVQCQYVAAESVIVCEAAEALKEQAGK